MLCVSTVSYSFLINGQLSDSIAPQRVLRQGDHLSPYLFLLCADVFGSLLKKAHEDKRLQGIAISRSAPRISHLFFADNSVIFSRASLGAASTL